MASNRRVGQESSPSRKALIDAVEAVLTEQGYAAVTARGVAARAGLKHQLVYYYFDSLDQLLLAAYLRHTECVGQRIEKALRSRYPLRACWQVWSHPSSARLNIEFLALANHSDAIRAETIALGGRICDIGFAIVERNMSRAAKAHATLDHPAITPFAVVRALASFGTIIGLEATLGFSGNQNEALALIEWCLEQLEPLDEDGPADGAAEPT